MKCRICKQDLRTPSGDGHHAEQCPMFKDLCLGCWIFKIEMEKFLIRAIDRTIMGNWTEGWLSEIITDPKRYLETHG